MKKASPQQTTAYAKRSRLRNAEITITTIHTAEIRINEVLVKRFTSRVSFQDLKNRCNNWVRSRDTNERVQTLIDISGAAINTGSSNSNIV